MAERRTIPVYVSLEEAAECMSVSVKTIRRLDRSRHPPGVPLWQAVHSDQAGGPRVCASADPRSAMLRIVTPLRTVIGGAAGSDGGSLTPVPGVLPRTGEAAAHRTAVLWLVRWSGWDDGLVAAQEPLDRRVARQ